MGTVPCFASAGCSFIGFPFRTLPPTPLCRVRDRMSEYREIIYRDVCVSARSAVGPAARPPRPCRPCEVSSVCTPVRCPRTSGCVEMKTLPVKSENQKALDEVLVEVTERNFYNFE